MNETRQTILTLMMGPLLVAAGAGCTSGAADEPSSEGDAAPPPEVRGEDGWTAESTTGVEVTISLDPFPLHPGPVRLLVALTDPPQQALPISLDLVSPEMPMHGIVRYETEASNTSRYQAVVDIPMEGFWELYVNLDYGADAAVFELDVSPSEGSSGHEHQGGAPSTDTGLRHRHEHLAENEPADTAGADEHHVSPEDHMGATASTGAAARVLSRGP